MLKSHSFFGGLCCTFAILMLFFIGCSHDRSSHQEASKAPASDTETSRVKAEETAEEEQVEGIQAVWEDAKRRGVNFKAFGNEPDWHLEIQEKKQILFVTSYGEERYVFDYVEPEVDELNKRKRYAAHQDGKTIIIEITEKSCMDTMSGEQFQSTVKITLNGQNLNGCGNTIF